LLAHAGRKGEKQRPAAVSCLPLLDWWEIEGNLHAVKIGAATEIDNPANSVLLSGIICNTEELRIRYVRELFVPSIERASGSIRGIEG
jgi:hypothetical protein